MTNISKLSPEPHSDWRADPNSELSAQLRARIIAAAKVCMAESGADKLRMEHVAREADCSRATLYRYFGSKDEILLTIAMDNFQRINAEVDEEVREVYDVRLKLVIGLARSMAVASSADGTHTFTMQMIQKAMRSQMEGISAVARQQIGPVYKIAQKKGWVRNGITLDSAVEWVIHCSTGLLSMGWPEFGGRELSSQEQVQYLCRFLIHPIFDVDDLLD